MALVKCKECGHKVSTEAKICPSCGIKHPAPTRVSSMAAVLIIGIFILTIWIVNGSNSGTPYSSSSPSVSQPRSSAVKEEKAYYVTAERLNVRLSPDSSGAVTNALDQRQKVDVLEIKDGWARISTYYNGELEGVSGQVARWVSAKYLSRTRPSEEVIHAKSSLESAIKMSDDYSQHRATFLKVSEDLVSRSACSLDDLKNWTWTTLRRPTGRSM
jgi:hypothetical protein